MAADPLDIVTIEEAKVALGIDPDDDSDDSKLEPQITAMSQILDSRVGPVVQRVVEDEELAGGFSSVWVSQWPVTSFEEITEYSATTGTLLTLVTPGTDPAAGYRAERYAPGSAPYSGRLFRGNYSGCGARFADPVVVSYTAGRFEDTESVAARFKQACLWLIQNSWHGMELQTGNYGGEFTTTRTSFPRFGVPNAAMDALRDEWQDVPVVA